MSRQRKILAYAVGFLLGCLILMVIPREQSAPRQHPWHTQTAPEGTYPLTMVDDLGRRVSLDQQPRHFISLAPGITEILFAMDMGDHLMAVTRWCNWPPEAKALRDAGAHVGSIDQPNRETIAAYQPDLIIGSDLTPPEVYEVVANPPRTVAIALSQTSMDDLLGDIRTIGRMTGVPGKALELVRRLEEEREGVRRLIEPHLDQAPRRVLFLLSIEEGLQAGWAPGRDTWVNDLIESSHAVNVAAELGRSWGEVSFEALLALDPEVLIIREAETPTEQARLMERIERLPTHPVWRQVAAVRENRVRFVPHSPLNIPGPRMMEAYSQIARAIWE
ncbi:MAG: ABC transporter substrate-binding protein [Oceanipulchritudo sp.]